MGAFILCRFGGRLLAPTTVAFVAALLAFVFVLPTAGEARFSGQQPDAGKECTMRLGRVAYRVAGPCKGQPLVKAVLPEQIALSGKLAAAIAAEFYCRKPSTDVSAFTRKATACPPPASPPQRLLSAAAVAIGWPVGKFDPDTDMGMIEALSKARLPDG